MATEKLPAGITKDKQGRYVVRPYDRAAKKKVTPHKFDSLADAVAFKEDWARRNVVPTAVTLTVAQFAEEWMTDEGFARPKESTNIHNRQQIKKFVEDYGDRPMVQITRQQARKWATEHPGRLGAVRAMWNDAIGDDRIPGPNPFSGLRVNRSNGRKHQAVPTKAEVDRLVEIAYDMWADDDWAFFGSYITVAAYTGMRLGELLAMRWSKIDWQAGTYLVDEAWNSKTRTYTTTKNNRVRKIVLFTQAVEALRILPKDGPDGLVWRSMRGSRIEPNLHYYYWAQVRERWFQTLSAERYEELKELDFHTLRHFHASWEAELGIPPRDIADQLGHTDGGALIQSLYGHLYPDTSLDRRRQAELKAA